jgi:hypothetical protein
MKTRILEVVDSRNKKRYFPQYKFLFWWRKFENLHGCDVAFDSLFRAKAWLNYNPCKEIIVHEN